MSSFYEDASLVMIPSGYKTSKVYCAKPTDGAADLSFTRTADTATRVGPDGLIEKVRTNLLLQSNTFTDATWAKLGVSVTDGQAGYDGTNNATLITVTSAFPRLNQNFTNTGLQTLSVYAKAADYDYLFINSLQNATGMNAAFDLVNGTMLYNFATGISSSITSVGNGWWKIVVVFSNTTFGSIAFGTSVDGSAAAWSTATAGSVLIQDAQIEGGDIATDYIATTTAAVSVGPVANVPRLDYLNSSCPRLLLEPQRTNLTLFSEQLDNAYWSKARCTVSANVATSPDGYVNADGLVEDTTNNSHPVYRGFTFTNATAYTFSIFAKKGSRSFLRINLTSGGSPVDYNFDTKTATSGGSVVDCGNGWLRLIYTWTTNATSGEVYIEPLISAGTSSYLGNGSTAAYLYGAALELGAYATSYIPTLGAAVTRGADAASKTGISSLIGQTQGTFYAEINASTAQNAVRAIGTIQGGANYSRFRISAGNALTLETFVGGSFVSQLSNGVILNGTNKVAFCYKNGEGLSIFLNGTLLITGPVVTTNPAGSEIKIGMDNFNSSQPFSGINQVVLFPTRLTNAQILELTTL